MAARQRPLDVTDSADVAGEIGNTAQQFGTLRRLVDKASTERLTLPPDTFVQNLVINSRREPGWPR